MNRCYLSVSTINIQPPQTSQPSPQGKQRSMYVTLQRESQVWHITAHIYAAEARKQCNIAFLYWGIGIGQPGMTHQCKNEYTGQWKRQKGESNAILQAAASALHLPSPVSVSLFINRNAQSSLRMPFRCNQLLKLVSLGTSYQGMCLPQSHTHPVSIRMLFGDIQIDEMRRGSVIQTF